MVRSEICSAEIPFGDREINLQYFGIKKNILFSQIEEITFMFRI